MYGNAIVMGLSPLDVDGMSLAQYLAAADGWNKAHETEAGMPEAPSLDEYESVVGLH